LTATIRRQCVSRSCVPSRAAVTTRPAVVSRSVIMDARVEHFPLTVRMEAKDAVGDRFVGDA
jgi:hypothetical protein